MIYLAKIDFESVSCKVQRVVNKYTQPMQRNMVQTKNFTHLVPKPVVVVVVRINGKLTWALINSGSLGDFLSTTLADQLKVKKIMLEKPLIV